MGYPGGRVDIPGLAKVGGNATRAGDAFDRAYAERADEVAPGATLAGWAAGAALPAATEAWSAFVRNLAGQVRSFGTGLSTASSDYQRADATAADRVATAGTVPGPAAGTGRYGRDFP